MSSSESSRIKHAVPELFSVPFCPLLLLGPHSASLLSATSSSVLSSSSLSSSFGVPLTLALGELSTVGSLGLHSSIPLPTFFSSSSITPISTVNIDIFKKNKINSN